MNTKKDISRVKNDYTRKHSPSGKETSTYQEPKRFTQSSIEKMIVKKYSMILKLSSSPEPSSGKI